ncbi:hypothetical protein FRC09_013278 [Ceratobasidium sp. 395]|nr:hypothetical protein FRC09_013278 [Ceratobasidium sp. 395]
MFASSSSIYRQVLACIRLQRQRSDSEDLDLEAPEVKKLPPPDHEDSRIDDGNLMDNLTSRAITWLLRNYEDTKSADIALQAIAGASTHLPMRPLIDCDSMTLVLQRLDNCYATRQKTGKRYLKNPNLLEPVMLYDRALVVVEKGTISLEGGFVISGSLRQGLNGTRLCLVDRCQKLNPRSPNKVAFALASWAWIDSVEPLFPTTTWASKTIDVLESHCDDSGALNSEALLALLKSVPEVFANQEFDKTPLLIVLVRLLVSLKSSDSSTAAQIGLVLISLRFLQPETASNRPMSDSHQEPGYENPSSSYWGLLSVVKHPELIPSELVVIELLELVKHVPQNRERSDLVTIIEALQNYSYRPDSLEIQGFVIATSGYNSRYLADVVMPRAKPADDGSFAESELVRATYLSVVNGSFLNTLADPEKLDGLKLGLVNLESATTNYLKRSCCSLVNGFARCRFFFEYFTTRRGESVTPLLPLFPLLPLLPLLRFTESTDERILPYAMGALWLITDLIGFSNMSAEQKQTILDPVLSHEPFASARSKTNDEVCSSPELAKDMGYAEVWLSHLENVQGEALRHIYYSNVLETISPDVWNDFDNSNSELDSQSTRGRALALLRRCVSEREAAGDRPLWPLDDDLAAA